MHIEIEHVISFDSNFIFKVIFKDIHLIKQEL